MKVTGYPSIDKPHEKGYSHFAKNPIIPNMSVYNILKLINVFNGNEQAINCLNLNVTYNELIKDVDTLAKAFKELGIKANDIIPVCMPNLYQELVCFLAANKIGAIITFLNYQSTIEEIKYYLNMFSSPLYINYDKDREYNEIIKNGTKVRQIITLNKNDINLKRFTTIDNMSMGNSDFISFDEVGSLAKYYRNPINSQFGKQQDSIILYTSGTTGSPKAVLITNENIISSGIYMKNSIGEAMNKGKKCLVCVDFSYPYGSLTSALMTLMSKKEAILTPGLNAKNFYTFLQRKPNYIFGIPPICNIMLNDPEINKMDLSFLQVFISGGDFLSPKKSTELLEFLKRHGSNASICNGSGNAETTGANTNAVGIKYNPMSVGKPLVGTNVKIISPETGEELKYNEVGYICYSGKHVFKEYFNDKETTSKVKKYDQNGVCWYITDTLGFIDEEGYAHIVGRDRDFIITFGETGSAYKIYCNMVQESIASINFIDSCIVVGVSDSTRDKVGYAFVKLKSDYNYEPSITEKIILDKCNSTLYFNNKPINLKSYEIPKYIQVVDEFPQNEKSHKIDYEHLRIIAEEQVSSRPKTRILKKGE